MVTNRHPSFRKLAIVAGVTLVIGLSALYFLKPRLDSQVTTEVRKQHQFNKFLTSYEYRADPLHIWEKYQESHRFPFDNRIKLAYARTLELGATIFQSADKPKAKISEKWQNEGWLVKVAYGSQNFEDHLLNELPTLAQVSFSQREMLGNLLSSRPPASPSSASFDEVDRLIQEFNTISILKALLKLDQILANGERSPELFLRVSRCYTWLAMLEPFDKIDVTQELCAKALAYHNIGSYLGGKGQTEWLLILVAMGYWGEADQVIKSQSPTEEKILWQALKSYIHYDASALKEIIKQHPGTPHYYYLLGLIYKANSRCQEAVEVMEQAYKEHPECLQFLDVLTQTATVGPNHEYTTTYPEIMLEKHQEFLEQEGEKDWGKWLKVLGDGFIQMRYFSSQSQLLEFWLNLESTRQLSPNSHPVILDLDTYKYLVKAEIFESLRVRYDFLLYSYGVHERAKKLIEEIVEAFPDDSFSYTLQAMYYLQIGQNEESKQNFMNALKQNPSQFVYKRFIKPSPWLFDRNKFGYSALKHWRDKFSTEASNINDLAEIYHNFGYRQLSNKYLRMATKLNPFYPWSYNKLTSWNNNLKYIEEGLKVNPDSYPLLKAAGYHYQSEDTPEGLEKAITLLQRAIKIVPRSEDAYKDLASIYRKQEKYSQAIDTLKEYLKYDNETLTAVHIKNEIGSIYYDQEDYQKAYEVYKEAASSWQANSLLGVGYSLEKMGRLLEAEEYFQNTAERYPNSSCMELVKFYWRQNRDKEAKDTIIKYLPLNSTRTIIESMVDHFQENKQQRRIWPTFQEVFKSPKDILYLARILTNVKEYRYAIPVWEKCFEGESNSWIIYLYRYYQCMEKIHGTKKALEKIRPYIKHPVEKYTFVMELQREKLYDATIKICKEFLVEYPQDSLKSRRLGCLSMMTLAALMSGKEDMVKDVVDRAISDLDPKYDDILFVRYLRGELDEHKLLAQINPRIVGRAAYYIGMKRLLEGKKEQAENYFTIVKEWDRMEMNFTFVEIHLALAELERLADIPKKKVEMNPV